MVVTVLEEKEGALEIAAMCEKHGIKHYWIKFRGASEIILTDKNNVNLLRRELAAVYKILENSEERCMVHCSAGMHRTGVSGYTLMRLSGLN